MSTARPREGREETPLKVNYEILLEKATRLVRGIPEGTNGRRNGFCILDEANGTANVVQAGSVYYALAHHRKDVGGLYPVAAATVTELVKAGHDVRLCSTIETGSLYVAPQDHVKQQGSHRDPNWFEEGDFRSDNKPYLKVDYVVRDGIKEVADMSCGYSSQGAKTTVRELATNPNSDRRAYNSWDKPGKPFSQPYTLGELAKFTAALLSETAHLAAASGVTGAVSDMLGVLQGDIAVPNVLDASLEHTRSSARAQVRTVLDKGKLRRMNDAAIAGEREAVGRKSKTELLRRRLLQDETVSGPTTEDVTADRWQFVEKRHQAAYIEPFTTEELRKLVDPKDLAYAFAFAASPAVRTYFDGTSWHLLVCGIAPHPCTLGATKGSVDAWIETSNHQLKKKDTPGRVRISTPTEAFSTGYSRETKRKGWTQAGLLDGDADYDVERGTKENFFALDVGAYLTVDIPLDSTKLKELGLRRRWALWRAEDRKRQ